ncbi:spore germination protein, GerA family [Schinkia azotoformans MEV2011]|uniref:Spore germination protein, GerA family n=1 Tax=Schinkia azotoformans MEV2011 TaxID=1348973 RepID=A0A072NLG7_SCHAZ|nr:spore germination protein [Schinkia azotoformans]KEF37763.1 spore germination protein, GerA family [Schinkia azotoformans MEV2011]
MFFKKNARNGNASTLTILQQFKQSNDFLTFENKIGTVSYFISYYKSLIDVEVLHRDILPYITESTLKNLEALSLAIPSENKIISNDIQEISSLVLTGAILIYLEKDEPKQFLLIQAQKNEARQISAPEVEFSVIGPKEAFVESMDTNINLIRKRVPSPNLQVTNLQVGKISKTQVAVLHIDGIANKENVNTVIQRIGDLEFDQIIDSSYLTQMIADNHHSPFPVLLDTERPDRAAAVLAEGKVVIVVDGSPHTLIGPTTLIEYFSAFEDYFLNPHIASAFRLIRIFSVAFSLLMTSIYVAILTHHFELLPKDLMSTLVSSRTLVPFPPFLEALVLELVIELLREAGARLPTKVGQTIGIVGGIVIGTASVEAGLTSNVLLIIIALSALASFTTPVYQMGNTIRLLRFPFLLFAHVWGLVGIVLCFSFFLTHLLRLTSLGRPYLEPIYPPRVADLKDSFIRMAFVRQSKRPIVAQTENIERFSQDKAFKNKDIDE